MKRAFRVDFLDPAGSAIGRGSFDLLHSELLASGEVLILGGDGQGRRVTLRIPTELIEDVGPSATPPEWPFPRAPRSTA